MPHRGRPRQYIHSHTRWQINAARRRHGQQGHGSISGENQPFFLYHDPRAIYEAPVADISSGTILDAIHEAIDAPLPPRETDLYSLTSPLGRTTDLVSQDGDGNVAILNEDEHLDISANRSSGAIVRTISPSPEPDVSPAHSPRVNVTRNTGDGATSPSESAQHVPGIVQRASTGAFSPEQLAASLVDQLEQSYQCQQHASIARSGSSSEQASLSTISGWVCPDVLSQATIAQYGVDWNTLFPIPQRRKIFTGLVDDATSSRLSENASFDPPTPVGEQQAPTPPVHIDLESDNIEDAENFEVWVDIDSAGGVGSSLAMAREGIAWKAGRAATSNLRSSLHLDDVPVRWYDSSSGRYHDQHRPVHQIPHLPFGRLINFHEVELYILFPRLYDPTRDHWVITLDEYEMWTNKIFLRALGKVYPSATMQHLPSSAQHIQLMGTAAAVEGRARGAPDISYTQDLHYPLDAKLLPRFWDTMQGFSTEAGLTQFREALVVLTAKNLKLSTRGRTWAQARDLFFQKWNRAINPAYLQQDFYDIAKEVVPARQAVGVGDALEPALTLSWRRCCLESFSQQLTLSTTASGSLSDRSSSRTTEEPPLDGHEVGRDVDDEDVIDGEESRDAECTATEQSSWRQEFYPQSRTQGGCWDVVHPRGRVSIGQSEERK